ncbi:MAG: ArsR/SmtB family transcription factor [Candidatus Helarchaeota archaeon]
MTIPNKKDLERLERYIRDFKNLHAISASNYISNLRNIIESYPLKKVKKQLEVFKAVEKFNRFKILILLNEKDKMCTCEIIGILNLSQSNVSHHLQILERAELITNFTQGKWKFYKITEKGKKIIQFILDL